MPRLPIQRRPCKKCGDLYEPKRKWQSFCSVDCRNEFHGERYKEALKLLEEKEKKQ